MNILVVNHYFEQDIDALQSVGDGHAIRVVPYSYFREVARRYFPEPVFTGLEEYHNPAHTEARQRYTAHARQLLHELYYHFPFDVIVSPSDTFFYLRAVVEASREMGVPFVVLQKETTISPHTMAAHALAIGRYFPFIGDLMLVCSQRHRQFWLNTGADPSKIIVTGQPRFDFYHQPERWRMWPELGLPLPAGRQTILFFSYDPGAYSPEGEAVSQTWAELRAETEAVLMDIARLGSYTVLIKPHPQQDMRSEAIHLRRQAGLLWKDTIWLLPGGLDTRQLIVNADMVIGFQTTALFEAMIAGKEVLYTYWTEPVTRFASTLIPFHEMDDALRCVRSPRTLKEAILAHHDPVVEPGTMQRRHHIFAEYLGPLDGQATRRAMDHIQTFVDEHRRHIPTEATVLRRALDRQLLDYCRRALLRARFGARAWQVATWLLPLAYPLMQNVRRVRGARLLPDYTTARQSVEARRKEMEQRLADCQAVLRAATRKTAL